MIIGIKNHISKQRLGSKLNLPFVSDLAFRSTTREGLALVDELGSNASILPSCIKTAAPDYTINISSGVVPSSNTIWVFRGNVSTLSGGQVMGTAEAGCSFFFGNVSNARFSVGWGSNEAYTAINAANTDWHTFIVYDKRLWIVNANISLTDVSILNVIATVTPTLTIASATFGTSTKEIRYFNTVAGGLNIPMGMSLSFIGSITDGVITWSKKHIFNNKYRIWDLLSNTSIAWNGTTPTVQHSQYASSELLDNGHSIYHYINEGVVSIPYVNGSPYNGIVPTNYVKVNDINGSLDKHNIAPSLIRFPLVSAWNRSNATIYADVARLGYYDVANPSDWHISELNQLAIHDLFFNTDQDIVFVKMADNSVDVEDRVKLIELFSYTTAKTGDDLIKVLKYTKDYNYFV